MRFFVRIILFLLSSTALVAHAERCPEGETGIDGRFVVWEENLNPPALRGLAEVTVYAFERGQSAPNTRYVAVSDVEGNFCILEAGIGEWSLSVFEPFTFRPIVRELDCASNSCDAGELPLDTALRISDEFLDYDDDWWGGSFAQTVVMPEGAVSLVKVSFRDGAALHTVPIQVFEGQRATGTPIAAAGLRVQQASNRDSAVFQPGEATVQPGATYTIVSHGGWAPWRSTGKYTQGQAFSVDGQGQLDPLGESDLALNLDIDGPDGNLTSMFVHFNDGAENGGEFAQSFVARSASITHASVLVGGGRGERRIQAFISASLTGPAIGPIKETRVANEQGVAFSWYADAVPTTVGQEYFLRIRFPEYNGLDTLYTRKQIPKSDPEATSDKEADAYRAGLLYVSGNLVEGDLWGRIMGPAPKKNTVDTGTTDPIDIEPTSSNDADLAKSSDADPSDPVKNASTIRGGCQSSHSAPYFSLVFVCLVLLVRRKCLYSSYI